MGPAFNPFFWLYWCISFVIAILVGTITFYLLKKRINSAIAIILASSIFFLLCYGLFNWSLSGPPSPRIQPKSEDIVGSWQISPTSLRNIQAQESPNNLLHTLEFKEDGTFIMTNMPSWWLSGISSVSNEVFDSGRGTWAIEKNREGEWLIQVHVNVLNKQNADIEEYIYLLGHEGPYTVYVWNLNDMESGIIGFERQADD